MLLPSSEVFLRLFETYKWEVNFTVDEAKDVQDHVIDSLNLKITDMGREFGWKVIFAQEAMKDRGWCAGDFRELLPVNPREWTPYASHQRRIRTANDSLLTQWPRKNTEAESGGNTIIERENGFYGMFHPNAQGHAAIAEILRKQVTFSSSAP